jgi:D-glycero-alpha-D-manno-heptose-7-phosphate kinase
VRSGASAPARLDFAGGWTDVAPFAPERGGTVVNAAIELRAEAQVAPAAGYELRSDDLDLTLRPAAPGDFEPDGRLDLLKAAVRVSGIGPCRIRTRSDAPPGSGLGSSGALGVALVAALDRAAGRRDEPAGVAERAWRLEAVEARLPGGRQDQYAAALGGFHRLGFGAAGVTVMPLAPDAAFRAELGARLLLCYTGQSRVSSDTIARVMAGYARGDATITGALEGLVAVALRMAEALDAGDLARVGTLLTENWRLQQRLDPGMRTAPMAALERALAPCGVLGGKAAGAGAGGSMFFLVRGDMDEARRAARVAGAVVLPVRWAGDGVRTW